MSEFLRSSFAAPWHRKQQLTVIPCGGRADTFAKFCDAIDKEPDVTNVLLVDAEEPVAITADPCRHLLERPADRWKMPNGVATEQCHLMTTCMESWLIVDRSALRRTFGPHLNLRALPPESRAEHTTPARIRASLNRAVGDTPSRAFDKIKDAQRLLCEIDASVVRKHCQWCDRLLRAIATWSSVES